MIPDMTPPPLSIVIPTHDTRELTLRCLDSLFASPLPYYWRSNLTILPFHSVSTELVRGVPVKMSVMFSGLNPAVSGKEVRLIDLPD
jgi:hypothetical protein